MIVEEGPWLGGMLTSAGVSAVEMDAQDDPFHKFPIDLNGCY